MTGRAEEEAPGQRLRSIRHARGKSLAVVAGLADISTSYLSRLESGDRALDRRSLVVALARALEVAPSEITGVRSGAGELEEDGSLHDVRLALLAVGMDMPEGRVRPVAALREQAYRVLEAQRLCDYAVAGAELPGLIRDLQSTVDVGGHTGEDERELLRLLVLTHVQGAQAWLGDVGASPDLAWLAARSARGAAERLEEPRYGGLAAFGLGFGLLAAGGFDLAARTLATASPGTSTSADMQVSGMLALTGSLVSAAQGDRAEQVAALDHAADLAGHTGEGNALWFGFGPSNVGVWRMSVALELGDHAEAARVGATVNPDALPSPTRQAAYWREYGRALSRLPKRRDEAVLMLRKAELISPARIHRHPFMRSVLAELLARTKRDAVGRELRGMAFRAGLPV